MQPLMISTTRPPPASGSDEPAAVRVGSLAGSVDRTVAPALTIALQSVREVLGMDVAYVSEVVGDEMVFREVDGDAESFGIRSGQSMPLRQTYCQRMLDGRLPNLIPDTRADDRAASLPMTQVAGVGAFATVPLTLSDGRVYGTLCAAGHERTSLDFRGLQFLKVLARVVADQLERGAAVRELGHLAQMVDTADDAIAVMTPDGVVTSWNPACERIHGYRAAEAIGRDIVELIALPGQANGIRETYMRVAAGHPAHHEERRRRADGVVINVAVTLSPVRDRHGRVSSISAMVRDVSAQVRQARFRAIERDVIAALADAGDAQEAAIGTLRAIAEGLDCDCAALWEVDRGRERLHCTAWWLSGGSVAIPVAESMRSRSFAAGEDLPGEVWQTGEPVWIENLQDVAGSSSRNAAAASAGLKTLVGIPLRCGGETVGVVEFFGCQSWPLSRRVLVMAETTIARLADALARHRAQAAVREARQALEVRVRDRTRELRHALAELEAAQIETVHRLSRAVEFRDEATGAHIARISSITGSIARRAGLGAHHIRLLEQASPLHDVGKVAIPDNILLKPGPLTAVERTVMETHAQIGHELLDGSDSPILQLAATIALSHHERYDGQGYPQRLERERIPIEGRIVAIADVFDALTSDRVYRSAMPVKRAVEILRAGRGSQFDPRLLDLFLEHLSETTATKSPSGMQPS
jgi:PAS domain S-box-containing protein